MNASTSQMLQGNPPCQPDAIQPEEEEKVDLAARIRALSFDQSATISDDDEAGSSEAYSELSGSSHSQSDQEIAGTALEDLAGQFVADQPIKN